MSSAAYPNRWIAEPRRSPRLISPSVQPRTFSSSTSYVDYLASWAGSTGTSTGISYQVLPLGENGFAGKRNIPFKVNKASTYRYFNMGIIFARPGENSCQSFLNSLQ
jgi:hypothetical protein